MSLGVKGRTTEVLRELCSGDSALRRSVLELVQASEQARKNDFLASMFPAESTPDFSNARAEPTLPRRIGRYRIDSLLGEGGFGYVYRGFDEYLDRAVAVKVPRITLDAEARNIESYLKEARTLARLKHPRIVPVYDVGCPDDGPCFVVSELLEGGDLAQRMRESPLQDNESADLIRQVAEALSAAHEQELVHRDIKPANILLDRNGTPHLADFGLAFYLRDRVRHNEFVGTPQYMSPEQAAGSPDCVDRRSDIYSLGVVLYELLTGQTPFSGSTWEILDQIQNANVVAPRSIRESIPEELESVCLKALSRRPDDRYQTATEFAVALEEAVNTAETSAPGSDLFKRRFGRRMVWGIVSCGVLTLAAIGLYRGPFRKVDGGTSNPASITSPSASTPTSPQSGKRAETEREIARAVFHAGGKVAVAPGFEPTISDEMALPDDFRISVVNLTGCNVSATLLADVNRLESLMILDLSKSSVDDRVLQTLNQLPQLRDLYLSHTRLTPAGLAGLSRLTSLRNLVLDGSEIDEVLLLQQLRKIPQLTQLSLQDQPHLSSRFYVNLVQALPDLSRLIVNGNSIDQTAAKALAHSKLWGLSLSRGSIGTGGVAALAGSRRIEFLWLQKMKALPVDEIGQLSRCKTLRHVDLAQTPIDDTACESLCELKQLKTLDLRGTRLSDRCLKRIRDSNRQCEVLSD